MCHGLMSRHFHVNFLTLNVSRAHITTFSCEFPYTICVTGSYHDIVHVNFLTLNVSRARITTLFM
jgi:Tfp pilus assembly protein PilO